MLGVEEKKKNYLANEALDIFSTLLEYKPALWVHIDELKKEHKVVLPISLKFFAISPKCAKCDKPIRQMGYRNLKAELREVLTVMEPEEVSSFISHVIQEISK